MRGAGGTRRAWAHSGWPPGKPLSAALAQAETALPAAAEPRGPARSAPLGGEQPPKRNPELREDRREPFAGHVAARHVRTAAERGRSRGAAWSPFPRQTPPLPGMPGRRARCGGFCEDSAGERRSPTGIPRLPGALVRRGLPGRTCSFPPKPPPPSGCTPGLSEGRTV